MCCSSFVKVVPAINRGDPDPGDVLTPELAATGSGGYLLIAGASVVEGRVLSVWFSCGGAAAYGFSLQVNAVGGVDETVENGVGQSWAADNVVPTVNR